jgi:tellurite resistance protein
MRIACLAGLGLLAATSTFACSAATSDVSESHASDITSANGSDTLSAGLHHTCAITTEGSVRCWGNAGLSSVDNQDADPSLSSITLDNVDIMSAVANADGAVDAKEHALVAAALATVTLPEGATMDALLASDPALDFATRADGLSPRGREAAYEGALAIVEADGTVSDAERSLLELIAPTKLGLANARIAAAVAQVDGVVAEEERAFVEAALQDITLPEGMTLDSILAEELDLVTELQKVVTTAARDQVHATAMAVAAADGVDSQGESAAVKQIARTVLMLDDRSTPPAGTFVAVASGWRHS